MKLRFAICLLTSILLCTLTGCFNKPPVQDSSTIIISSKPVSSAPTVAVNPLTGLNNLNPDVLNNRPVAIMINNIKTAQTVQSGLSQADIVYETYVEGGITRLMAVFKDISKVGRIGTVRSARYSYVDLAVGHDAVYFHAGENTDYCTGHLAELGVDDIDLLVSSKYSFRVPNGKAYEHTLFTDGKHLSNALVGLKKRTTLIKDLGMWQDFLDVKSPKVPGDGVCNKAIITMSSDYVSGFEYDTVATVYKKTQNGKPHKDYVAGKQLTFKNVLVLKTTIINLEKKLVKSALDGGDGYYISQGGFQSIKWSKGSASSPLKITLADGSACPMNAGNTWVMLVNKTHSIEIT